MSADSTPSITSLWNQRLINGVTTATFRDLPVARLSAALLATKPSSSETFLTFSLVARDTEPFPESAREAVDLDTPARVATSESVLTHELYRVRTTAQGVLQHESMMVPL